MTGTMDRSRMDLVRQTGVFDPLPWNNQVAVVGVGALGTALALQLVKLGIEGIRLYDGDTIEAHNIPNQCLYGPDDVGRNKATAAAELLRRLTGHPHHGRSEFVNVDAPRHLRDRLRYRALFVCVDSMSVRSKLWNNHVYANGTTQVFGEARMGVRDGAAYLFDPQDGLQADEYGRELYPDEQVAEERAACGATLSIGATAMTLACALTWMFIAKSSGSLKANEVLLSCDPWNTSSTRLFPSSV